MVWMDRGGISLGTHLNISSSVVMPSAALDRASSIKVTRLVVSRLIFLPQGLFIGQIDVGVDGTLGNPLHDKFHRIFCCNDTDFRLFNVFDGGIQGRGLARIPWGR